MKIGQEVYFFDLEGDPRKGEISVIKTRIRETKTTKSKTVQYEVEGVAGLYTERDFVYNNIDELMQAVREKIEK